MFFSALAACISFFRKALQSYNLYFISANFLAKFFVISFRLSRRKRSSKASAKVDTFPITSKYFRNFFLKIFHRPDIPTLLYNIREKDRQKNNDATPRNRASSIKKNIFPDEKNLFAHQQKTPLRRKKDLRSSKKNRRKRKNKAKLRLHFFSPGQEKKRFPTKNIAEETQLTK